MNVFANAIADRCFDVVDGADAAPAAAREAGSRPTRKMKTACEVAPQLIHQAGVFPRNAYIVESMPSAGAEKRQEIAGRSAIDYGLSCRSERNYRFDPTRALYRIETVVNGHPRGAAPERRDRRFGPRSSNTV